MTKTTAATEHQARGCDHCGVPAVFRVAIAASYSAEHMEEMYLCVERFQEFAAYEPQRVLGVVNLTAGARTMVGA